MKKKLLLILTILSFSTYGQNDVEEIIEQVNQKMDSVEVDQLSTKYFLNKGFMIPDLLEDFMEFKSNKEDNFILNRKGVFKRIYRGLRKSYTGKKQKIPRIDFKQIKETYRNKQNTIPIGIIQTRGEWMETYELDENISAKVNGYNLSKEYSKIDVFNASVLKRKAYSGTVNFEIIPEAFYIKSSNRIRSISVDLSDGMGFQSVSEGDIITAQYQSTGEKVIAVKFELKNKHFISYSSFDLVTLNEETPTQIFSVGRDVSKKGSEASKSSLTGGSASLYAGCDGVLDKPVIVVEGFDPTNDNNANDIRRKYLDGRIESSFRNNGYDVIYVDFNDGGGDIRTNARVVRDLIVDVNREKRGSNDIIVIGESMGGLVARYALRKLMEMNGITHNVSHYISFDAPHKGANVPLSLQSLFRSYESVGIRDLFNIQASTVREGDTYLSSKAAKQLLLRYEGPNPHPDFYSLQSELNSIGFPRQGGIRNIAVTNGALNGTISETNLQYNPGDRTFSLSGTITGVINVKASTFTNKLNSRTLVSWLRLRTLGIIRTTNKEASYNFNAFNYDLATGGTFNLESQSGTLPINLSDLGLSSTTYGNSAFSFVPFFSSTSSTAPRTRQSDLNRTESQLRSNNWSPFDRIYGSNSNTLHVSTLGSANLGWNSLFSQELGLPFRGFSCTVGAGSAVPLTPRITGPRFSMCEGNSTFLNVDNDAAIGDLYVHRWRVTGPVTFNFNGNSVPMDRTLRPGRYTVTLTRSFDTSSGLRPGSRSVSTTFTVYSKNDSRNGCSGGSTGPGGSAKSSVGEISADLDLVDDTEIVNESTLKFWPNPVNGVLNVNYEMLSEGNVAISLVPMEYLGGKDITITNRFRPKGQYEETYYTKELRNGVYILKIKAGNQEIQKKVIIQ